jgi:CubicO group peptidase (beta-lactamase class C family)
MAAGQRLRRLRDFLEQTVRSGLMPGAVCLVGCGKETLLHESFGFAQKEPNRRRMRPDTVFDLASLTKVAATAPAVMLLVERGLVRLRDPAAEYLPDLSGGAKDRVTLWHLLTHTAGLPAWVDLAQKKVPPDQAIEYICRDIALEREPGEEFVYSDLGFILLGEIVGRASGQRLDTFARQNLYEPIEMAETCFLPSASLRRRCAATEWRRGKMLAGTVHDENAEHLGGVAGHAGLFSTAADLAIYARMLLARGKVGRKRVMSAPAVDAMTGPQLSSAQIRGLGWDISSDYSAPKGDLFGPRSFGHTGFTGASIWIDPDSRTFVILLTNSVHPKRGANIARVRGIVANLAAAGLEEAKR